jgi:hypothetical protein
MRRKGEKGKIFSTCDPVAKFIVPDLRDIVDSGIRSSRAYLKAFIKCDMPR